MKNLTKFSIAVICVFALGVTAFRAKNQETDYTKHPIFLEACKQDATKIDGIGSFGICSEKDESFGLASTNILKYVVYDSTNTIGSETCKNPEMWRYIYKKMYIWNQLNAHIKPIQDSFYIVVFEDSRPFEGRPCPDISVLQ